MKISLSCPVHINGCNKKSSSEPSALGLPQAILQDFQVWQAKFCSKPGWVDKNDSTQLGRSRSIRTMILLSSWNTHEKSRPNSNMFELQIFHDISNLWIVNDCYRSWSSNSIITRSAKHPHPRSVKKNAPAPGNHLPMALQAAVFTLRRLPEHSPHG